MIVDRWIAALGFGLLAVGPALASDAGAAGPTNVAAIIRREAAAAGIPFGLADAVVAVESGYDPTRIGSVGEIGLMQVRPATAALLGFRGSAGELAKPDVNVHYGTLYLAGAWRRAGGDLCRTLMKYRAGHGEEVMSPRSIAYCERAQAHLGAARSGPVFAALPASSGVRARRKANAGPWALPPAPTLAGSGSVVAFLVKRAAYVKAANAYLDAHRAERETYFRALNARLSARRTATVEASASRL